MNETRSFGHRRPALRPLLIVLLCLSAACATRGAGHPPGPTSGYLDVPGGRLYYEEAGSGPAVVFLHGGFGDRRMWDDQFAPLAREFRVVRYDHRGFGRSSAPTGPYSALDDLRRLLDHLGIERAHLVGNSLGGSRAIEFAIEHPERVGKLVVIASAADGYPIPPENMERVMAVIRAAADEGVPRAVELWLANPMLDAARTDPAVFARVREMVTDNGGIWRMQHWPSGQMRPPAAERLAEVRVPTLLIVGDRDDRLMLETAAKTAEGIPGARLVTLSGTDHLPQMEKPAEVNRLLREFLLGR